jgi:membrane associated rhomboid family serine protease
LRPLKTDLYTPDMSVTLILVIATVAATLYGWNNANLQYKWIFNPYAVARNNEYFRFITSGFIHSNWMHLIFNMFMLYAFGRHVEVLFQRVHGELGLVLFLLLYIIGIIISDIPTFLRHKDHPHYNSLGASGGVSSILFSFILFLPVEPLCLYGLLCLPGVIWGGLYLGYSYYMSKRGGDNINHDAHLYGALFGIIFTIIIYPAVIQAFISDIRGMSLF